MFPFSVACSVMLCFRIKHPHFYCIISLSPLFPLAPAVWRWVTVWWHTGCQLNCNVLNLLKRPFKTFLPGFHFCRMSLRISVSLCGGSCPNSRSSSSIAAKSIHDWVSPALLSFKAGTMRCVFLYHSEKYVFFSLKLY